MNEELLKAAKAALNEIRKAAAGGPPPAGPQGPPQPPPPPPTIPGGGKGAPVPPSSQAQPAQPATAQPGVQTGVQAANGLLAWLNNNKGKSVVPPANH
ncbi:MAG: hypothetical protein MJZ17_05005 [Bacteroidales bacterium]|nr:hypothetical protein [Bacteroidales bacterium]